MSRNSRTTRSTANRNHAVLQRIIEREAKNDSDKKLTLTIKLRVESIKAKETAPYYIALFGAYAPHTYVRGGNGGNGNNRRSGNRGGGNRGGGNRGAFPPLPPLPIDYGKRLIVLGDIKIKNREDKKVDSKALINPGIEENLIELARLQLNDMVNTYPIPSAILNNLGCANALLGGYTDAGHALNQAIEKATTDDDKVKNAKEAATTNLIVIDMFLKALPRPKKRK